MVRMRVLWLIAMVGLVSAGCASGPVELLDELGADEDGDCKSSSACLESGVEQANMGRLDEAEPLLTEACRAGEVEGCLQLGHIFALSAFAQPPADRAEALYQWGCNEAGDGAFCHALGELHRLRMASQPSDEKAEQYFSKACEMGEVAGCHDRAVVTVEGRDIDEDQAEQVMAAFADACERGLNAGCVNQGYMMAAGRGVAREHGTAKRLFEQVCDDGAEGWRAHRLAGLVGDDEPDFYAMSEFSPAVACDQLEVLVVGGFEERIIAAFDAEEDDLRRCYDEARDGDEKKIGRMTVEAGVSGDGAGVSPRIVDDELGLGDVSDCVEQMLARHLDDGAQARAEYSVRWRISFIQPPQSAEVDDGPRCEASEVQIAVSEGFSALQECGVEHTERHRDDPGAVVARWDFAPGGGVEGVAMTSTVDDGGLKACLRRVIESFEIPPFEAESCPVQVPLSFSDGEQLHFSVVSRR